MQSSAQQNAGVSESSTKKKIQGLSLETWGGKALRGDLLYIPASNSVIRGKLSYPLAEDRPPIEVIVLAKDFGKRGLKGGGVNASSRFQWTIIPDAYCAANSELLQQDQLSVEEDTNEAPQYTWRVTQYPKAGGSERVSEEFLFGDQATRTSEALDVNVDVSTRLADERTKAMFYASLVLDLQALGYVPAIIEGSDTEVLKKHHVFISLGVPAKDLKDQKTIEAAEHLKGTISVEQHNILTGQRATWLIEIVAVSLEAQPKGTLYAATRQLDGKAATTKKLITVIDIGGGDTYKYEIDLQGGMTANPQRLGSGTIDIARYLVDLIEQKFGIALSEIQAQEALYKRTIWKGGDQVDITSIIESDLKPRFNNLLTKIAIDERMLTTFIIFTGGGAALFAEELRKKIEAKASLAKEGEDYLIMPEGIASVANCVGLFAIGFYKIQARIRKLVNAYLDLIAQRNSVEEQSRQLRGGAQRWEEDRRRFGEIQDQFNLVTARLKTHVGQYFPEMQLLLNEQRQRQAASSL